MAQYDALVMCSGGLDSVVMLHQLVADGKKCRLIYCDFGKLVTSEELAVVRKKSVELAIPLDIVDVKGLSNLQSAYDSPQRLHEDELDIDIGKGGLEGETRQDKKFVTGYHCLLSVSSYAAHLTDGASVATAVTKEQADAFPSLHDAFTSWKACVAQFNPDVSLDILTPVIGLSKVDIVKLGYQLGVALEKTWSCTESTSWIHCGHCAQCKSRKQAFYDAGVADITVYEQS